jgi:hypothetical protein
MEKFQKTMKEKRAKIPQTKQKIHISERHKTHNTQPTSRAMSHSRVVLTAAEKDDE